MPPLTFAPPSRQAPIGIAPQAGAEPFELVFWHPAIGTGACAVLELCPQLDAMAQQVAKLPIRISLIRPVVGQYLVMLKTLAAAWRARSRPALVSALGALVHFGDSLGQSFTLEALGGTHGDGGRAALRVLDTLQRRLAAPLDAFAALDADLAGYLAQMAGASAELEADTRLVTQRLQADYVHAFLLSQQASTLQWRLDEGRPGGHARWPPGLDASQLRRENWEQASTLAGTRRQLDQLRAEQPATQAEADYLQTLLPTLSAYLAATERIGAGIASVLAGTRIVGHVLEQRGPAPASGADSAMRAALPHWQALAASSAALRA